jgi:MFS transporter, DHA1 family, tetracycline resistance protein
MAALALAANGPVLLGASVIVAVGQGLVSPTLSGLLSRVTPPGEQGAIFGTLSSAQTLARMLSYSAANILFAALGPSAPFWEGTAIALAALALAWLVARRAGVMGREAAVEVG